jgi:sodium-dependent dicarboxylate transporter 2/3/5
MKKTITVIILIAASIVIGIFLGENEAQRTGISILILIGGLWISEVVPLAAAALLVPVLAYFTSTFELKESLVHFANPIIYVFIGGFTLAAILHVHELDRWLASKVISFSKGNAWLAVVLFFISTSFLSMWMSNTATTAMLLPIGMSLIDRKYVRARTFVIIGIAYSSNIGGLATLIGSPPNLIAAAALNIDFITWMKFGLPATIVLSPLVILVLRIVIRPEKDFQLAEISGIKIEWSKKKTQVLVFFFVVVALWIASKPISDLLNVKNFDAVVAITATAFAPVLGLISWDKLERHINWGILILFGGGLCLSAILSETGTSAMIATSILSQFSENQGLALILVSICFMIFLTEISSNTGSAAILVPIMMEVATQFDNIYVFPMVMAIGISANCAFMLPVATPPNALAYSTNEISLKQMIRSGLLLNLIAIPIIWLIVTRNIL